MKNILKKPLITEKSTKNQKGNVYFFECEVNATKSEIKSHVESVFDVKVAAVNTSVCRFRKKSTKYGIGKISYWKKAMVTLKEGSKIAIYDGV